MATASHLFLSNRLDFLACELARALEQDDCNPLTQRVILVPDASMKPWLLRQIVQYSEKKGVAGIKVLAWQEGMRFFSDKSAKDPRYLELYLFIYEYLKKDLSTEVAAYSGGNVKRLLDLSKELAKLFLSYGFYGSELLLSCQETNDWQKNILQKIIEGGKWKFPLQNLSAQAVKGAVFCFACDGMPAGFWDFLLKLPRFSAYLFSPCLSFWGDLCSTREKRSLVKYGKKRNVSETHLEELDRYLENCHPLLANFGKLGRETLQVLDLYDLQIEESYDLLDAGEPTLLKTVQADLLYGEIPLEKREIAPGDRSIRLSLTGASRLREIQVLKDEIIRVQQEGIALSEMLVLAPNLEIYGPLIEWVFSDPESSIPYCLSEIDLLSKNGYWQGLKQLLSLSTSRWESDVVIKLIENPSFRLKQGWDLERLDQIRLWIREAKIRWGQSGEQKEKIVSDLFEKKIEGRMHGTWEEGIDRMLQGLIYLFPPEKEQLPQPSPISGIDMGDADALEEFLYVIETLRRDLAPLTDSKERRLESWADILEAIADTYLAVEGEKDLAGRGAVEEIISSLRYVQSSLGPIEFPFSALEELFNRKSTGQIGSTLLHAVPIAPLSEGAITPCRALFLIGQDEESFPRSASPSSLDLLRGKKEAPPLPPDRDRYLFLQAICSVQEKMIISYGHISPEEGKEMSPSLLVQELISYIKSHFEGEIATTVHPSFNLHPRCFQELECQSTSPTAFRAAQIFYGPKEGLQFWPPFDQRPPLHLPEGEITLSVRDLKALFRHPWKFYMTKILQMAIAEKPEENWEEYEVDFIKRAQILRTSLHQPLEAVIQKSEGDGTFPVGLFGVVARQEMGHIAEEWKGNLADLGLAKESLSSIRLSDTHSDSLPPVEIQWERLKVKIVGEVSFCSSLGPLHIGDDSLPALFRSWPEHLVALCALQSNTIFCIRSGKPKQVASPHDALRRSLELYFLGLQTPLPLVSEWVEPLLRKGGEELEKKFEGGQGLIEDPIYDWVLDRTGELSAEPICSAWGPFLKETLIDLIQLYPSRSKKGS